MTIYDGKIYVGNAHVLEKQDMCMVWINKGIY